MVNQLTVFVRNRGTLGAIGAVVLLLSSTAAFGSLEQALRRIFAVQQRHFIVQRLVVAGLIFGLGILLAISIFVTSLLTAILAYVPFALQVKQAIGGFPVVAYVTPLVLLVITFVFIIKYFLGSGVSWRHTLIGGAVFALLFSVARFAFHVYLEHLSNLSALYGSLTAVIALVLWAFYLTSVLLVSAEFIRAVRDREAAPPGSA
jgi:membrane protein